MAEKVIRICDWHEEDVEAPHREEWTNPKGEHRRLDLCDSHHEDWLGLWEGLEEYSTLVEEAPKPPAVEEKAKPSPTRRRVVRHPADKKTSKGPSQTQIIKDWARKNGFEVTEGGGRVPFNVELAWKEAGSPNLLAGE